MDLMMIDGRGKAMVQGGRHGTARHARYLRRMGCVNATVREFLRSAKLAYLRERGISACGLRGSGATVTSSRCDNSHRAIHRPAPATKTGSQTRQGGFTGASA